MYENYSDGARVLKIMAEETRLKIIHKLSGGECCACEILEELNITQPTLSYHMKLLTKCGLVDARKDGIWMRYQLNSEASKQCREFMGSLLHCSDT